MEESDGDKGYDEGGGGNEGEDKGDGGEKSVARGVRRGVIRGGGTGGDQGGAGSKDAPRQPPTTQEGDLHVAVRERRAGAHRAYRANPPPSDPAPARQVTYGVGG